MDVQVFSNSLVVLITTVQPIRYKYNYIFINVIIYLIQRAVVRGSIKPCDGERFPSIFVRLDNYEVLKWIMETVFPDAPPIEDPSKIVIQGISWQNAFFSTTKV